MTTEEEEKKIIYKNALAGMEKLKSSIGCDGVLLNDNEVAALIIIVEAYLHMYTDALIS